MRALEALLSVRYFRLGFREEETSSEFLICIGTSGLVYFEDKSNESNRLLPIVTHRQ
jgi:hypothetical protein